MMCMESMEGVLFHSMRHSCAYENGGVPIQLAAQDSAWTASPRELRQFMHCLCAKVRRDRNVSIVINKAIMCKKFHLKMKKL